MNLIGPSLEPLAHLPLPSAQPSLIPRPSPSQGQTPPQPSFSQPPTPQIPPPAAAVTNVDETMQNLLHALITLGQAMPQNLPPQTLAPTPSTQTYTCAPDAFDGSNL